MKILFLKDLGNTCALYQDLFMAGTHTTSSTIEWAMTELLHKPETRVKARSEVEEVLGKGTRVQESDTAKLPYLQAVVKETFRVHPPVPLIIREEAGMNSEICGYTVPKSAQVLVQPHGQTRMNLRLKGF